MIDNLHRQRKLVCFRAFFCMTLKQSKLSCCKILTDLKIPVYTFISFLFSFFFNLIRSQVDRGRGPVNAEL